MKIKDKEVFFTKEGLSDSKHILNTNPDKEIDIGYLDLLEQEGVTLEQLEEFEKELDIFRYKTQITIHGISPTLKTKYIGNYKSLIENKNKSIGVKWRAIDLKKKAEIFKILQRYQPGWLEVSNSNTYHLMMSSYIDRETQFKEKLEEYKKIGEKFDKSLFYGHWTIYGGNVSFYGYILILELHINAIPEGNIPKFITKALDRPYKEIIKEIKAEEEVVRQKEQRKLQQKELNQIAKEKYIQENIIPKGFIKTDSYKILQPGDILFALTTVLSSEHEIVEFRENYYLVFYDRNIKKYVRLDDETGKPSSSLSYRLIELKNRSFYYKPAKPEEVVKTDDSVPENVRIVDYSEKAVAVYGDTKKFKGDLTQMGGKWNSRLREGPGWIFKASKKQELQKYFGL